MRTSSYFRIAALAAVAFAVPVFAQTGTPAQDVVQAGALRGRLGLVLSKLGGPLLKPGQGRIVLTGNLAGSSGSTPVQATWQFPGVFRVDFTGSNARSLVFNGSQWNASGGQAISDNDAAILESVLDDSAEDFLTRAAQQLPMRYLGSGFRNPAGEVDDVYQVLPQPAGRGDARIGAEWKLFCFDSRAQTLTRVRYRSGGHVVETVYSNWSPAGAQLFPGTITRTQDGVQVFQLTVQSASAGATLPTSSFQQP